MSKMSHIVLQWLMLICSVFTENYNFCMQSKQWLGTSFLQTELHFKSPELSYSVWQRELCVTTNRPHWQFFVMSKKKIRMKGLQQVLGDKTCHLEVARSASLARQYCMKLSTRIEGPFEHGVMATSVENVVSCLTKTSVLEVLTNQPQLWRSVRSLQAVRAMTMACRTSAPTMAIAFVGETGSGKTKITSIISSFVGTTYWKNASPWWDGYDQQALVVLDDFRGDNMRVQEFLALVNPAPLQVQIKGGTCQINSNGFIYTSNVRVQDWWRGLDYATAAAVRRRIKEYLVY